MPDPRAPSYTDTAVQSKETLREHTQATPAKKVSKITNPRVRNLIVVLAWATAISLVLIKTYNLFYTESLFSQRQIAYLSYKGPTFTELDLLILGVTSLVVAMVLTDIRVVVYGFFTTILGSFAISSLYVFAYIWYVLDYVQSLGGVPWGWEDAAFLAVVNVFRFIFPMGILCCLMGITLGIFIKGLG
jgi:hypothetical protein